MGKEFLKLRDTESKKRRFHPSKRPMDVDDVNKDKIVKSDKFPFQKKHSKYFFSYKNNEEVTPLCVLLPKRAVT